MGNRAAFIPLVVVVALLGAAFLFSPQPAAAASRTSSFASGIIDVLNQRLCERQEKLGGRVQLIHPSKCTQTPPPTEPVVTLSASPTTISVGESATLTWTSEGATSCTAFLGWTGSKSLNGSQSVSPTTTTTYQLDCTGPGGVGSDDAIVTVTVAEPEDPSVDISADPMTITNGSSTTLTWNSDNADSCTASNGWTGTKAVDGTQLVSPGTTTVYTITCEGDGGSANDSVTVTVNQPDPEDPTLDLTANPVTINQGSSSLLSWSTTNASSCEKSGGWSGATTTSGTLSVSPIATTTYSMECIGSGGTTTDSVTVNVVLTPEPDAPTVDLVAAPTSVTPGAGSATTTLTWTTTNASSCMASGGTFTGSKAVNGSEIITPSATTTYALECVGAGGTTTDSVTVNFVPTPEEPAPTVDHLLISEVHYNPDTAHGEAGSPDDNEWVEIYNPTGSSVTLNNWWIGDTTTSIDRIPNGTTIPAGGYLVISQSSTTPSFWPATSAVFVSLETTIGGGLANASDAVLLLDASSATTTVDAVSWGSNTLAFDPGHPDVGDGDSLARSVLTTDTDTAADWTDSDTVTFGF